MRPHAETLAVYPWLELKFFKEFNMNILAHDCGYRDVQQYTISKRCPWMADYQPKL